MDLARDIAPLSSEAQSFGYAPWNSSNASSIAPLNPQPYSSPPVALTQAELNEWASLPDDDDLWTDVSSPDLIQRPMLHEDAMKVDAGSATPAVAICRPATGVPASFETDV